MALREIALVPLRMFEAKFRFNSANHATLGQRWLLILRFTPGRRQSVTMAHTTVQTDYHLPIIVLSISFAGIGFVFRNSHLKRGIDGHASRRL